MELAELTVRGFRNLAALDVEIPPAGVVVIGENGQGKTNLLEAVYYLVLFRSLRGAKDRELVRFGEAGFFIGGRATGSMGRGSLQPAGDVAASGRAGGGRVTAGYDATSRRKKVTLDGVEASKLSDAVGRMLAVPFSPADGAIMSAGPGARRRFLDVLLSISEPGYLRRLAAMRLALKQRNAALRRGRADEAAAFDRPLAETAAPIARARRGWVARWAERFSDLCTQLGERGTAVMRYQGQDLSRDDAEGWAEAVAAARDRDLRRAVTTVGPHRDDLRITLAGRELRIFGSAGQQRTGAIALRLLEAETLREAHGATPVALFDDVFAELDEDRQGRLLALIREVLPGQAIVVAPRDAEVPAALFDRPRWQITEGRLER